MSFRRSVILLASILMVASLTTIGCSKNDKNVVRMSKAEKAKMDKDRAAKAKKIAELESELEQKTQEADQARAESEAAAAEKARMEAIVIDKENEFDKREQSLQAMKAQIELEVSASKREVEAANQALEKAQELRTIAEQELQEKESLKAQALAELEQAKQASAETQDAANRIWSQAINAQQVAAKRVAKADQALSDAEARMQLAELQEDNALKSLDLAKTFFASMKLDPVFEKIAERQEEDFVFQLSLIGEADVEVIETVRKKIADLNISENYKSTKILSPSQSKIQKAKAEKSRKAAVENSDPSIIDKTFSMIDSAVSPDAIQVVDDRILIKAEASKLKDLRDSINAVTNDKQNLLLIVRLVERVRISLDIQLKGRTEILGKTSTILSKKNLGTTEQSNLISIDDLDLNSPGTYIFGASKKDICKTITNACIAELTKRGFLDKHVKNFKGDSVGSIRSILQSSITNSIEQIGQDLSFAQNGEGEKVVGWLESMISSNTEKRRKLVADGKGGVTIAVVEQEIEEEEKPERKDILEAIILTYKVSMVDPILANGLVFADVLVDNASLAYGGVAAVDIAKRELELKLPVANEFISVLDVKDEAVKSSVKSKDAVQQFINNLLEQTRLLRNLLDELSR